MSNTKPDLDCGRVAERLDLYLDHELPASDAEVIERHLESCDHCTGVLKARTALRLRLRTAVQGIAAPAGLLDRVAAQSSVTTAGRPGHSWLGWGMAAAAAAMLTMTLGVAYQFGHLRLTPASQESYIGTISGRIASVMRVGLGDHVHCAVFRKFPRQAPPPETFAAGMGPQYYPLLQLVRDHIPGDQRVVMAHHCRYHGRKFAHLTMADGSHLTSLVIAERQPGETFQSSGLAPALSDAGLPIYHSNVQRFQINGFQTSRHLVYLVSDLSQDANQRMMASLARPVRDLLDKLEL